MAGKSKDQGMVNERPLSFSKRAFAMLGQVTETGRLSPDECASQGAELPNVAVSGEVSRATDLLQQG
jgi:hypothetical protein